VRQVVSVDHHEMDDTTKYLRLPIRTEIGGRACTLLSIGHVAHALRRTTWTVRYWERIGLLPESPFVLNPDVPRTRRRLYPEGFVNRLGEIADRGYLGKRLDHEQWQQFHDEVLAAYWATVAPLLSGVTAGQLDEGAGNKGGQAITSTR
jgi:hypothetical protein